MKKSKKQHLSKTDAAESDWLRNTPKKIQIEL